MSKPSDDSTGWDTLPQGDIRKTEPRTEVLIGRPEYILDEREDDMLICARDWQFGYRCIARRPALVTNDEWRPIARIIIAALCKEG